MKKIMVAFATLALAVASAAPRFYHVTLSDPAMAGGTELKPGEYELQLQGDKVIFKSGKTVVEAPAKVEENDHKYSTTSVRITGDRKLEEIQLGGTKSRVVFRSGMPAGE